MVRYHLEEKIMFQLVSCIMETVETGASVIFEVDLGLRTLMDFKYQRKYVAEHGEDGSKKEKQEEWGRLNPLKVSPRNNNKR